MLRTLSLAAIASVVFSAAGAAPTTTDPAVPAYVTAAIKDSRRPAKQVAADAYRKPAEMVMFAGIKPGDNVLELIPGGGYFTRIFAHVVGFRGHVYAFQPTEQKVFFKGKPAPIRAVAAYYHNVTVMEAPVSDMPFPKVMRDDVMTPVLVDVVWTSQNYHDLHNKMMGPVDMVKFNRKIFATLKPGGAYIVLDHAAAPGTGASDTQTLHRIDPEQVKKEVEAAGFKFAGESDVLRNPKDDHSLIVFDPKIRHHTDQFIFKFVKPMK